MIFLTNFKSLRIAARITRSNLAHISGIDESRIALIEKRKQEPWYSEALRLHRVLNTAGINQLISADLPVLGMARDDTLSDNPTTLSDLGERPAPTDEEEWRYAASVPLSLAVRICIRYGLTDPAQLAIDPLTRQVWDVLKSNERGAARGQCPWCLADTTSEPAAHLPTCIAHNLFAPRLTGTSHFDYDLRSGSRAGKPRRPRGVRAYGIAPLRKRAGLTQAQVADHIGVKSANHYARIERGELSLSLERADLLGDLLGATRDEIYAGAPATTIPSVPAIPVAPPAPAA